MVGAAYLRVGFPGDASCQVGEYSALPHGSLQPQVIREGEIILIDDGCTRRRLPVRHVPHLRPRQGHRQAEAGLRHRPQAQAAALAAARPGVPCHAIDAAARKVITDAGYGPDYKYFTHRLGHGIGMDGHEWPYLVRGNTTPLAAGMTFSDEPGIYITGEFGIRLEDDWVVTPDGGEMFTPQSPSLEDPFAKA